MIRTKTAMIGAALALALSGSAAIASAAPAASGTTNGPAASHTRTATDQQARYAELKFVGGDYFDGAPLHTVDGHTTVSGTTTGEGTFSQDPWTKTDANELQIDADGDAIVSVQGLDLRGGKVRGGYIIGDDRVVFDGVLDLAHADTAVETDGADITVHATGGWGETWNLHFTMKAPR